MTERLKFGQRVAVDRRGLRHDVSAALHGASPAGRIVGVVPTDPSLEGCVLVTFDDGGSQWVHEPHVHPLE
jgi:hypothetical protein